MNKIDLSIISNNFQSWFLYNGIRILAISLIALFLLKFGHILLERSVRKTIKSNDDSKAAEIKRENTLIQVLNITLNVSVLTIASLLIMTELGVNIAPLLAGAGIAGVALGFGAQYLVRDVITGIFILLENQYAVGDVVCIGQTCGSVQRITLRITTLRDMDGKVHYIPNGEIKIASNLTQSKSSVNLDIGVSYNSDIDKVERVINEVGEEMAKDKEWKNKIRVAPHFLRLNNFAESAIEIKIVGETEPKTQWGVTGEYRRRLKKAFDKEKIEIPFPQRDIHIKK
jgi:small conductance mechanosensitive channel